MVLTFLGTKGGTGTTTLAVNMAADIRRITGRPTLLVDAKAAPGDVAVFLGLRPRHGLVELLDQVGWTERALLKRFIVEHACGLHVLPASEGFGRPGPKDAEGVDQTLRLGASFYDFVVVDAGSALTPVAVSALAMSDVVMLVANPDVPCLRNLQRLDDALRLSGVAPEHVRIVLNRTSDRGMLPADTIARALNRRIEFQVPSDYRTVAAAVNGGVPVSALRVTDLHQRFETMARTLIGGSLAITA